MLILFINIETGFVYIIDFSLNLISEFYFELLLQYSVELVLKNEVDLVLTTQVSVTIMIPRQVVNIFKSGHSLRLGLLESQPAVRCLSGLSSSGERKGLLERTFGLESNTGSADTKRWKMFIPAFSTHICLGAPYGWSAIRLVFSILSSGL